MLLAMMSTTCARLAQSLLTNAYELWNELTAREYPDSAECGKGGVRRRQQHSQTQHTTSFARCPSIPYSAPPFPASQPGGAADPLLTSAMTAQVANNIFILFFV
jgi:hypothetical protein